MGADPFNLISKEAFQIVILILHFVIPDLPLLNLQIHHKPKKGNFHILIDSEQRSIWSFEINFIHVQLMQLAQLTRLHTTSQN